MRESFVFYRSFRDAIQDLDETDQLKVYNALCDYALDGTEPTVSGVPAAIFKLIKPQIDANNRRFENGKKGGEYGKLGGRPKKTPKKPLENPTETPNVNVNDNVNDNVKTLRTKKSNFNNFEQNEYDFDQVEKKIISNGG